MDALQQATAGEFADELIELGVLSLPHPDRPVLATAPVFCIPKAGQPGQWRVLADLKAGGQNSVVGKDPVFLHRPDAILPHLYTGGYSAVGDASKMFYQFPTCENERPYLGCIHPISGEVRVYTGLPMGATNSPAIAGRMGAAFIRLLLRHYPKIYSGTARISNTWWDRFNGRPYDPKLGHGFVLLSDEDGLPSVLIWVHVDDFLIHGPTFAKTAEALSALMDQALAVGLLFNPSKITPPGQLTKYCGFIYDTVGIPTLVVPADKRDRAVATLDYVMAQSERPISRLCLSVVLGLLQSLVDATPSRLGQTFLIRAYRCLYEDMPARLQNLPREKFYTMVSMSEALLADFRWWRRALEIGLRRPIRYENAGNLVTTWGDGSGTGLGGTIQAHDSAEVVTWMGQWSERTIRATSNWKEMCTLALTLEGLVASGATHLRGATVFYFTDNLVTYFIVTHGSSSTPALQELVHRIKLAELELGCLLEVVHVPGVVMIIQGTDGLSRGVWVSPLQLNVSPTGPMPDLFAPVPYEPTLLPWALREACLPLDTPIVYRDWRTTPWTSDHVLSRCTFWTPPPEIARQLLCRLITLWTESPADTRFFILVPRLLQRQWGHLSPYVRETQSSYLRSSLPLISPPTLPIPVVLLVMDSHVRALPEPDSRLDPPPLPAHARWHRERAEFLRGL